MKEWRGRRFGEANPTRLDNPLWASQVFDRPSAYAVNEEHGFQRTIGEEPTWCFQRFGQSETALSDGRTVYIGGEHEDWYDPDFCIYNDVVIVEADETAVSIYGYPRDAFPPTDFHTATLDGDTIWIVGSLGYAHERRPSVTQVCRLDLATMAITQVPTTGASPGWLHGHTAELVDGVLVVRGGTVELAGEPQLEENIDEWALELATLVWTRRTQRDWQRWSVQRVDRERNLLWELRQALWHAEHSDLMPDARYRQQILEATGREPAFDALHALYSIPGAVALPERDDDGASLYRIELDGVVVRFTEEMHRIAVMVEGRLSEERLRQLQHHVIAQLETLHATPWELAPA